MRYYPDRFDITFHAQRGLTKVHFRHLRKCFGRDRSEILENLRKYKIKIIDVSKTNWWILENYEIKIN